VFTDDFTGYTPGDLIPQGGWSDSLVFPGTNLLVLSSGNVGLTTDTDFGGALQVFPPNAISVFKPFSAEVDFTSLATSGAQGWILTIVLWDDVGNQYQANLSQSGSNAHWFIGADNIDVSDGTTMPHGAAGTHTFKFQVNADLTMDVLVDGAIKLTLAAPSTPNIYISSFDLDYQLASLALHSATIQRVRVTGLA
jgi:hypothetical protein